MMLVCMMICLLRIKGGVSLDASFGDYIKLFRVRLHLNQSDFASCLGVSQNTVSAWEQGTFEPSARSILKIVGWDLSLASRCDVAVYNLLKSFGFWGAPSPERTPSP